MRSLGLTVTVPTPTRPVVRAVLLDDGLTRSQIPTLANVTAVDEFDLTTTHTEWAALCSQFSVDVSARVSTLAPDVVVVRRADFHRSRGNSDGPRLRLVVEGAVSASAFAHVANTHLRMGVTCADRYGTNKDAMDLDGKSLVVHANRAEAAGAALSGLFGNR